MIVQKYQPMVLATLSDPIKKRTDVGKVFLNRRMIIHTCFAPIRSMPAAIKIHNYLLKLLPMR